MVPFRQYEWNVTHFGFKNAHSEFQMIMNKIFKLNLQIATVYINDVLVFSQTIDQTFQAYGYFHGNPLKMVVSCQKQK